MAAAQNPFLEHLNPPQAQAVAHAHGPLLVFAGAGSGKTRVITFRVANLIATHGVVPQRILAVTFTNKAASEMRERLVKLLGEDTARDVCVGTFHATCARLLRRHAVDVGLTRDFVIYDDGDQKALVARVLKELKLDDKAYPPKSLLWRIMKEKQEARRPADLPEGHGFEARVLKMVFTGYEEQLARANAVDFEDLISHVARLAGSKTPGGEELRARFDHVLVDEFQDTNQTQYSLVSALASRTKNLCVVGDDDQSIYRWRGGDVRIIRNFQHEFAGATVVKLEENYRSTARIVRAALAVIKPSLEREPKELFTSNPDGARIQVVTTRDEHDEAAYITSNIRRLIASGTDAASIAVFYRIHAMSRVLEEACRIEKVPYRIVGGTRFFERAEVKDLLSYLRVLLNPRSDVDLLRIINVPARGIGDGTLAKLSEVAQSRGTSLYDALLPATTTPTIPAAARKKLTGVLELLEAARALAPEVSPSQLAERILSESGYRKALRDEDSAEADARLGNLDELIGSMKDYEQEAEAAGEEASLAGYLERVSLSTSADENKGERQISLMTIHSSKGLEFDAVFIIGAEEKIFPYERPGDDDSMDLEEERRLAYVALTRARKQLWLTMTRARSLFGNTRPSMPSRFLRNLPATDVAQSATTGATGSERPAIRPVSAWGGGGGSYGGGYGGGYRRPGGGSPPSSQRPAPPPHRSFSSDAPPRPAWTPPARPQTPGGQTSLFDDTPEPPASAPPAAASEAPSESYIERDPESFLSDDGSVRRGTRVKHARFGVGTVIGVEPGADPAATVNFPAWGQKKVLLRFLQPMY
jgi:DNA helicase-2/ATP-dependent DNA helicase PcrA